MSDEFYVGYLAKAPAGVGRFLRRRIVVAFVIAAALALVLVYAQQPFAPSTFEYGNVKSFAGTLEERPYPTLLIGDERYLLVAAGKHGAAPLLAGHGGHVVTLRGMLIARPEQKMIEVIPGSVQMAAGTGIESAPEQSHGMVELAGEIVDSKCWTGVMNPGRDKVHRDCAARCISGGLPPLLISATRNGSPEVFQLVDTEGAPLGRELLPYVAEPVSVRGELRQRGKTLILHADPRALIRHR
jgi:hypothetical protein